MCIRDSIISAVNSLFKALEFGGDRYKPIVQYFLVMIFDKIDTGGNTHISIKSGKGSAFKALSDADTESLVDILNYFNSVVISDVSSIDDLVQKSLALTNLIEEVIKKSEEFDRVVGAFDHMARDPETGDWVAHYSNGEKQVVNTCLLYTSPSPRDS